MPPTPTIPTANGNLPANPLPSATGRPLEVTVAQKTLTDQMLLTVLMVLAQVVVEALEVQQATVLQKQADQGGQLLVIPLQGL